VTWIPMSDGHLLREAVREAGPAPHPTETMPSDLFLTRRCGMLERENERLLNLIASAVARLHGDDDRMEVADFLERDAAPW
jgi:hypothetical protein